MPVLDEYFEYTSMRGTTALILLLLSGCSRTHGPPSSMENEVREYVRLAVALGERDPDALDYYYGPADWVADIRRDPPTLPQLGSRAAAATARLSSLQNLTESDQSRRLFLIGQLAAIEARAGLLSGIKRSFDEEARIFFGKAFFEKHQQLKIDSPSEPVRKRLAELLGGEDNLAARYEAFDARFAVPPDRLPDVMARAIQACREQTTAHLSLPSDERVTIQYVSNKPWSAYSYYQGNFQSIIRINTDLGLTVDRALKLACHEGYPGHHVFNLMTDRYLVREHQRPEFSVQPTFSPQSFLSEAAASVAPEVAFSESERLRLEQDTLFPLAGLKPGSVDRYLKVERLADALSVDLLAIARDYLDGNLEFARAATALEHRALMTHSDATLRYLNEYRSYVMTYTEGRNLLRSWLDARAARLKEVDGRWGPLRELMTDPYVFMSR
jgi:hypothetical protein